MTSPVKNIIFDLGKVLFSWNPQKVLTEFCSPSLKISFDEFPEELLSIWREFDRGVIAEAKLQIAFASILNIPHEMTLQLMDALKKSLKPIPETVELLHSLHRRGYGLYCLSNISSSFGHYLKDNNEFFELFDGIIFSADVKLVKPELEIYHLLCDRYHIVPAESVFLDDRIENIEAAKKIGIHAIHFTSYSTAEEELNNLLDH